MPFQQFFWRRPIESASSLTLLGRNFSCRGTNPAARGSAANFTSFTFDNEFGL
jgi:hypothetical protein